MGVVDKKYYDILGVKENATLEELKKAFIRMNPE